MTKLKIDDMELPDNYLNLKCDCVATDAVNVVDAREVIKEQSKYDCKYCGCPMYMQVMKSKAVFNKESGVIERCPICGSANSFIFNKQEEEND